MDDMRSQGTSTMERGRDQAMGKSKDAMQQVEQLPANYYYAGVFGSILFSAFLFLTGRRNLGIFVGLWPPTILNLAMFAKQLRPSREIHSSSDGM